jgi:tetratricopeptide (TPR) repeat protein
MPGDPRATRPDTPGHFDSPALSASADSERESRLFAILTTYLQAVESGLAPRREDLLESHPDLAAELAAFLDEEERLYRLIEPIRSEVEDALPADSALNLGRGRAVGHSPEEKSFDLFERPRPLEVGDFGDYELIEIIGSGGMGVVFRARQKGLDREVAVKMIRGGDRADEDDLRRFRLEAGASAQLDHPHIVPIYEVGEHQGYCYYVMKLIEGGSLDKRLHEYANAPRAAAHLVATVARAVHHAHQRGVLHRDLKPSNILIDDDGGGHVADFGLAKRLGAGGDATQTGLIIGTPSYMAPEQASGKKDAVTTATDVYGLGALLYSLLTGRPPFRGDSILETIEQVRLREPDPPTGISGRLDRDLQTICLTCLRKEPHRRYASAAALADDLDRWGAGEPIAARPTSPGERAWRWARREPLSAGLAAALVIMSALGVAGLVVSNVIISRERDEARTQRRIALDESRHAEMERQRAEDRSRQARRAVDEMYTEVAEKWLYEQPKLSQVQHNFLQKALVFYEQFSKEEGADPAVQLERAKALSRLAWLQLRLGRPHEAEASLYKPVEILTALSDRFADRPVYLEELGHVYATLASRFSEQKRWTEANPAREKALEAYSKLVNRFPGEARHRTELATNQAQLGLQYQLSGRPLEAQKLGADGLASLDSLQHDFPGRSDPHDLSTRMRVLEDVGAVLVENRRYSAAEKALRESIAIAERLPDDVISHQDLLHRIAHINIYLGHMLGRVGKWREAEAIYNRAESLFRRLAADFPDLPLYQVDIVDAELGLVDVLQDTGRRPVAEQRALLQVENSERLAAAHPDLVNCRRTLLTALMRMGQLKVDAGSSHDVEAALRRAVEVAESLAAVEPSGVYPRHRLGTAQLALGNFLTGIGRDTDADALFTRAIATLDKLCHDCPAVPDCRQTLGEALSARGELRLAANDRTDGEHAFERALNLFRENIPQAENDPELADRCVRGLTSCPVSRFRDPSAAVELAGRAGINFPGHRLLASTLGRARYRANDWEGAIVALAELPRVGDPGDSADCLILAMAYHHKGDNVQAHKWFERAMASATPGVSRSSGWRRLHEDAKTILAIP